MVGGYTHDKGIKLIIADTRGLFGYHVIVYTMQTLHGVYYRILLFIHGEKVSRLQVFFFIP